MTLGVIMLVHTAFDRAEQMVRHWVTGGCPVVVHVDKRVDPAAYTAFVAALGDLRDVGFGPRFNGEWGMWGLIAASQAAARQLLAQHPGVNHVYLASGSCLPLRPISELRAYLVARADTDFIESVTTRDVPWTVGGFDSQRFSLRFPFSWKRQRRAFDAFVRLQQRVGYRRQPPLGIVPHLGSQWWCLTRRTLCAILDDPRRPVFDRYFKRVWIPDESYYQTLVRLHGTRIESRSLTLSKFDFQGKPHVFYNDHAALLARSGCFVARKIWPHADALYAAFPRAIPETGAPAEPQTRIIDRIFAQAVDRRANGRRGLVMQSRFPASDRDGVFTAGPYSVMQGFDDLIPDFATWLAQQTGVVAHGRLFAPDAAHFVGGASVYRGALSSAARLRDYNPRMFLVNLIWNGREYHQSFQFGPTDNQQVAAVLTRDGHANIRVVTGAWAVTLFRSGRSAAAVRAEAARLQQTETSFLKLLDRGDARARRHVISLADFLEQPLEMLQNMVDDIPGHSAGALTQVPDMVNLDGFAQFLQDLKNQGMNPYLVGTFTPREASQNSDAPPRKPYLIGGQ